MPKLRLLTLCFGWAPYDFFYELLFSGRFGCAIVDRDERQVILIGGNDGPGLVGAKVTRYDYSALLEDVLGVEGLGFKVVEELPDLPVSAAFPSCAAYNDGADQVSVVCLSFNLFTPEQCRF